MKTDPKKRLSARRGQTVVYMCVIMVILVVMMIFLVDLQYFVRLRARTQTGIDAAVLTAAKWQGKSLNIVGELNLVKASTIMLSMPGSGIDSDLTGGMADGLSQDTSAANLIAADQMIAEMQTRILYVGPLLGYISAQQAAKNNGLRTSPDFSMAVSDHIANSLSDIGDQGSLYEEVYEADIPYNGYDWPEPYKAMLQALLDEGIAAKAVNGRYMSGAPNLTGPGADLLMDPAFYDAVWNMDFCYFIRRGISSDDEFNFDNVDSGDVPYFPGSEFLSLYVGFRRYSIDDEEDWNNHLSNHYLDQFIGKADSEGTITSTPDSSRNLIAHSGEQEGLSELNWAVYDSSSAGWSSDAIVSTNPSSGVYSFINQYMRHDGFAPEYIYGGAAVRMYCKAEPSLLSGNWKWNYGDDPQDKESSLANGLSGIGKTKDIDWMKSNEERLQNLGKRSMVYSSAAAKPFGKLGDGILSDSLPPYESGIVLPVFSAIRLIPAAVVPENAIDKNYEFYKFLIEYFGDPNYPDVSDEIKQKYSYYIQAIEMFLDHTSGFHEAWEDFEEWREDYMENGADGIPGTGDDGPRDPCEPVHPPGGGGGGGPPGGPSIIH